MEPQKDLAIVIKSIQFEERHRIVTAITQNHGVISAMARNAIQSKRFGGSLDLFNASDWVISTKPHSDLVILLESQSRFSFENLKKDYEKLSLASAFTEFLTRVVPQHQPCPEFFQLHANALYGLNEVPRVQGSEIYFLNNYLLKLLQLSGNQPQMGSCLNCSIALESLDPHSSVNCLVAAAGWICPECRSQTQKLVQESRNQGFAQAFLRVTPQALREVGQELATPIRKILLSNAPVEYLTDQRDLFRWIEALFVYHLPGFDQKPLNSIRFLGLTPQGE